MALNKKIAVVAFDRQTTGKGVAAATKKYGFGLRGGSPLTVSTPQAYEELTIASRIPPSAYRSEAGPHGFDITTRAWPRTIGMLLKLALGAGSDTVTGAADPWTHTIIPQNAMDYFTGFVQYDTEYHSIRDMKVDTLSMSWDAANPLEVGLTAWGTLWTGYTTSFSPTNDDSGEQSFFPGGGTFQLETFASTPITADISGGTIVINNHLDPIRLSKSIEPDDMWPGWQEITVTLRVIPTDSTLWRKAVTNNATGTAISQSPVYGSFHTLFTIQPTPERSLDLTAPHISFDPGAFPDADPAGGPAEFEFTGTVVRPAAGAAFTAVVKNDQNTTAYNGS